MPDPSQFVPEEYAHENGDFSADVHTPEFQQELREGGLEYLKEVKTSEEIAPELKSLREHFAKVPDIAPILDKGIQDFTDLTGFGENNPDFKKGYHEKLALWISDIETLCRHAFAIKADNIFCCDKSARLDGMLTKRILPIIAIEFARIKDIPLDQVKLPKIFFINPMGEHHMLANDDAFKQKYGEKLKGTCNIVYDESSGSGYHVSQKVVERGLLPEEQYELFSSDRHEIKKQIDPIIDRNYDSQGSDWMKRWWIEERIKEKSIVDKTRILRENDISVVALTRNLNNLLPSADFESHLGSSGAAGGNGSIVLGMLNDKTHNAVLDREDGTDFSRPNPDISPVERNEIFGYIDMIAKKSFDRVEKKYFSEKGDENAGTA